MPAEAAAADGTWTLYSNGWSFGRFQVFGGFNLDGERADMRSRGVTRGGWGEGGGLGEEGGGRELLVDLRRVGVVGEAGAEEGGEGESGSAHTDSPEAGLKRYVCGRGLFQLPNRQQAIFLVVTIQFFPSKHTES